MGRCYNPECKTDLLNDEAFIGEIAHISPWCESNDNSLENLLLLCPTCHTKIDKNRTQWPDTELVRWQQVRRQEVESYGESVNSFADLREAVRPIFRRNSVIFDQYGPEGVGTSAGARRDLWLKFEPELVANDQKLVSLLTRNRRLLHTENQELVDEFADHVAEFIATRGPSPHTRALLFPRDLLSVFGMAKPTHESLPPSVSALQEFVRHLIHQGIFVGLSLTPEQRLTYLHEDQQVELDLNDRPRMQQIFFSNRYFVPQTTKVRLQDLVWVLKWMDKSGVEYKWLDSTRLTELIVANRYFVKFCYSYAWADVDEAELPGAKDMIVVNLHVWNKPDIDVDAVNATSAVGLHHLNQREFLEFCRRSLTAD